MREMTTPVTPPTAAATASAAPADRRRMRRETAGALLTLASLVVCAAGAILWVRGHWTADTLVWRSGHVVPGGDGDWQRREFLARSLHGRLVFWQTGRVIPGADVGPDRAVAHAILADQQKLHYWANEIRVFRRDWPAPMTGAPGLLGLRWQESVGNGTSGKLGVPMWMPVAATAVLPALHVRRRWRDRRVNRLAASPSSTGAVPA